MNHRPLGYEGKSTHYTELLQPTKYNETLRNPARAVGSLWAVLAAVHGQKTDTTLPSRARPSRNGQPARQSRTLRATVARCVLRLAYGRGSSSNLRSLFANRTENFKKNRGEWLTPDRGPPATRWKGHCEPVNHYAKWPQRCEAAINDAPSKATLAPTWEATFARACEVLDNWWSESGMPDITARGKEIARMLLRNSNGKREVAGLTETEMAALCRVSEETVRRKLRELERKQVIEKTIRAGRNVYLLSLRLVPDYFPCPPSVRRTEPKGVRCLATT